MKKKTEMFKPDDFAAESNSSIPGDRYDAVTILTFFSMASFATIGWKVYGKREITKSWSPIILPFQGFLPITSAKSTTNQVVGPMRETDQWEPLLIVLDRLRNQKYIL